MNIRKFNSSKDLSTLLAWAIARQSHTPESYEIPENGLVILNEDTRPICMGFIRKVEGGYGLIDGYITDPKQPGTLRNEALNTLTIEIIKLAKELGLSALLANTTDYNTLERSVKHGFTALPHASMVIKL